MFTGAIDEFAMYSRALTPAEVIKDMGGVAALSSNGNLISTWGNLKTGR